LAILRASWRTIARDPRLLVFPFLWLLVALALLAAALLAWALVHGSLGSDGNHGNAHLQFGVVLGLMIAYLVGATALTSSVALSRAAINSMMRHTWSFRSCTAHALRQLPAIAFVSFAKIFVRHLLRDGIPDRPGRRRKHLRGLGRLASKTLELAWWAATYLVVPVLARERQGGLGSIIRSTKLFKDTWREAFVGRLALGWMWFAVAFGIAGSIGLMHVLGLHRGPMLWLSVGLPVLLGLMLVTLTRTLDHVYRCALYVFATEGVVPDPFDAPAMREIWDVERTRDGSTSEAG
jgi:hypothetical protein